MSAIAVTWGEDCALMVADGVCYDDKGNILRLVTKIARYPHLNCVVGAAGIGGFLHVLGWALEGGRTLSGSFRPVSTFDELVEVFADICAAAHEQMHYGSDDHKIPTTAVLLGWSESRRQYEGYRVVSYDKRTETFGDRDECGDYSSLEAFTLHRIPPSIWVSSNPRRDLREEFGISAEHNETSFSMMMRMMCAIRAGSGPLKSSAPEDPSYFNAGGFLEVAMVHPGRIDSWIAHRWPEDELGAPIDPMSGDRLPAHLVDAAESPQPNGEIDGAA